MMNAPRDSGNDDDDDLGKDERERVFPDRVEVNTEERGSDDDNSGEDERELPWPGRFGEADNDVGTAHPLQMLSEKQQSSGNEERERPFTGRFGDDADVVVNINPSLKPLKGKERPSVTTNEKGNGLERVEHPVAAKKFDEANIEVANFHPLKNPPSPPRDDKQHSIPNKDQGLTLDQGLKSHQFEGPKSDETEQEALSSNVECFHLKQRDATDAAEADEEELAGNKQFSRPAEGGFEMPDLSDSDDNGSDDDNNNNEQRPGATRVGGTSRDDTNFDVENSIIIIEDVPIIAELTEDVEQRVQRQVEERLQNQAIAEAVEVNSKEKKTWFGIPRIWFIIGIVCTTAIIAIILGVTLPNVNKAPSNTSNPPNTTSPSDLPSRFTEFVEWLGPNITDDVRVFDDPKTAQYAAMKWLANEDKFAPPTNDLIVPSTKFEIYLERYIAALLFYSMQGPSWTETLNFLSEASVCKWNNISSYKCSSTTIYVMNCTKGIECNDDLEITEINLDYLGLSGVIPSEIGFLTSLEQINFDYNDKLAGSIPASMFQLSYLSHLSLFWCGLTGTISSGIGKLTSLVHLDLSYNHFLGTMTSGIGELTNLEHLGVGHNSFTGSIPFEEIGKLTKLKYFELSGLSSSTGTIPVALSSAIHRLSQLTYLDMSRNQFIGRVPFTVLLNLSKLEYLSLASNSLNGQIPTEIGLLNQLTKLTLYNNKFSGTLPSELGLLLNLEYLSLNRNQFSGTVPAELGSLEASQISLNANSFSGSLEKVFCLNNTNWITTAENLNYWHDNQDATSRVVMADCVSGTDDQTTVQCSCCYCCPDGGEWCFY